MPLKRLGEVSSHITSALEAAINPCMVVFPSLWRTMLISYDFLWYFSCFCIIHILVVLQMCFNVACIYSGYFCVIIFVQMFNKSLITWCTYTSSNVKRTHVDEYIRHFYFIDILSFICVHLITYISYPQITVKSYSWNHVTCIHEIMSHKISGNDYAL